tara:strand:+ start:1809 stop:2303 length:495 start_codon:yes stop_codon:yes gene_type:complete
MGRLNKQAIHKPHYDRVKRHIKVLGYTAIPGLKIKPIEFHTMHHLEALKEVVCDTTCHEMKVHRKLLDKAINSKKNQFGTKRKYTTGEVADVLHTAIFITTHISKQTYVKIGKIFGDRDHSSISHARKKMLGLCEIYSSQRGLINTILFRLGYPQLPKKQWKLK